jgi:hypothetical protein
LRNYQSSFPAYAIAEEMARSRGDCVPPSPLYLAS